MKEIKTQGMYINLWFIRRDGLCFFCTVAFFGVAPPASLNKKTGFLNPEFPKNLHGR